MALKDPGRRGRSVPGQTGKGPEPPSARGKRDGARTAAEKGGGGSRDLPRAEAEVPSGVDGKAAGEPGAAGVKLA